MFKGKTIFKRRPVVRNILEFDEPYVRLLQYTEMKGIKKITAFAEEKTDLSNPGEMGKALQRLVQKAQHHVSHALIALPRHLAVVKYFDFPKTEAGELDEMISLHLIKEMPLSRDEIVSDYTILSQDSSSSRVAVYILQKSTMQKFFEVASRAGITPTHLTIHSFGLFSRVKDKAGAHGTAGFLSSSHTRMEFIVFSRERLILSRTLNLDGKMLTRADKETVVNFVRDSVAFYMKKVLRQPIEKIYVDNIMKESDRVKKMLEQELTLPVELAGMAVSTSGRIEADTSIELASGWFNRMKTAGILLSDEPLQIDFLRQETKKLRASSAAKKELTKLAAMTALILFLSAGLTGMRFWKQKMYIHELEKSITLTDPLAERLETMQERSRIIKKHMDKSNSSIEILVEVFRFIPSSVFLSAFMYNSSGEVMLQGTSLRMSKVLRFVTALEKSKCFEKVELRYASKRKVRETEITDFQIFCRFIP